MTRSPAYWQEREDRENEEAQFRRAEAREQQGEKVMGTNYYIRGHNFNDDPEFHIGKRSAAGLYCWDCKQTLCKQGEQGVHESRSDWFDACPKCGKTNSEDRTKGAAMRELGFDKSAPAPKAGVASCSSFTFAMPLEKVVRPAALCCPTCERPFETDPDKFIENEYGDLFTLEEFMAILSECPIQYQEYGEYFS